MKSTVNAYLCILQTLFVLTAQCLAQTGPNPPPDEPPPGPPPPPPCTCCPETMTIANASVHFRQGFGRSPWISGTPKGYLSVHEAVPGPRLGTRAMLCYDHPMESRVVRRDAALGEVTVRNAMGVSTKYGSGGKPVKTLLSLDSQCLTNLNGEAVEQLPDRTRIVYGQMNAPVKIVTPDGVEASAADFGVDVVKDLGGIRQIWSRTDGLLDMTEPSTNSVLVSWYPPSAVSQQPVTNGVYVFSGNPLKTFTFIRTPQTVTTGYGLVLEERRGTSFLFTYEWKYMIGDGAWTLIRGQGAEMTAERVVRPTNIYTGRILQTRTVSSADGKVSSAVSELYSYDSHGYTLLKKSAVAPDGREQVLFAAARADTGATAGRFSSLTNAYGGSESYLYDSDGRMTRKTETLQGGIAQVTTNTYASALDAEGFIDRRPLRTVVTQNGFAVSDTAYVYSGTFESVTRTDPKTGASLTALKYLYSPASANNIEQGRVKITVNPDGSATLHAYASGDNGSWTETVTQGCLTPAFLPPGQSYMPPADVAQLFSEIPGKSTRTVNTHDFRGDIVRTDSYVHTGTEFSLAGWETHSYSVMHKKIGTARHDGTSEMSNWICSGPVWQRNADGTSVTNTFDTAKRIKTSTRYTPFGNVTKTYSYDADGRVVSQTTATNGVTIGCGGSGCGSTYSEFDTQGRTVLSVDAMGRTNRTSYSLDNRTVTYVDPAGAVVVESYATDGSLVSRTGSVMRAEYTTQGVDATTGTRWEQTTYGSPVGADYAKSYYNAFNQLVLQERPGFGGAAFKTVYAYNTKGQLETETRQVQGGIGTYDLPANTYAYNQLGDRISSVQTVANVSRFQSLGSIFTVDNNSVQQTSISVQSCSDATIPAMTNATITRLYPLENGLLAESRNRDVRGNETVQTVTQNPATYVRTTAVSNATSVLPAISISLAGLTLSQTDQHGCATLYTYDALMRQIRTETRSGQNNERLTGTYTHYNVDGQVDYTEDAFGARTIYGYDVIGRRVSESKITQSGNNAITQFSYDQGSRTLATWGATYPVAYEYDTAGRIIAMYTYRGTVAISSYSDIAALKPQMDRTQWFYDQATGLLTNKLYADGKGPSYSYTAIGQLSTRKWARLSSTGQQLLTFYGYNSFGSLTNTAYSDGTPSITFIFNALGQMKTITDASGTRTLDYAADGQMIAESIAFNTSLFTLHEKYDNLGRNQGYALSNGVALVTGTIQSYDTFGRLNQIAVDGITGAFTYGYLEGTHLQKTLAMPNGVTRTFGYEPNRDLLTMIVHSNATERLVQRDFTFDGLARLQNRTLFRANETPTAPNAFGYNLRSELTNAVIGANAFSYGFDPIGNRNFATEFGTNTAYTDNGLNQYLSLQPKDLQPIDFSYDADGNQTLLRTTTGIWHVTYNAENRPILFSNETTVVEMAYDYMGRRFEYKEIVSGTLTRHERYLYRGYLQSAALDMLNSASVKHTIVWDPTEPVATRPLALQIGANAYYYSFDQIKNVTELFDVSGALAATYDYSPFGQVVASTGDVPNPLTFSSEAFDSTLGLQYYNYRHLNTRDGRWVNRDPIEEEGGFNMYIFVLNSPYIYVDRYGRVPSSIQKRDKEKLPEIDCSGYKPLGGKRCATLYGFGSRKDTYPEKAWDVCEGFKKIYTGTPMQKQAACVASCLIAAEKLCQTMYTCCSSRNCCRLKVHVICYVICGFVPYKGLPPGGAMVGAGDLAPSCLSEGLF